MRPHPLDYYVGLRRYFTDFEPPCKGRVLRPTGFRVIERLNRVPGSQSLYLMYKKNIDTVHAIKILEKALGGKWKYAGLKDKEAQTVQFVSSDVSIDAFAWSKGNKEIVLKRIGTGSVSKKYLLGNLFIIDLSFECEVEDYAKKIRGLWTVPGIYGYQRFGSRRPISHVVGKFMIKDEWEKALEVLLGEPFPWESETSKEIRFKYYKEGPKAFLKAPRYMDVEFYVARKIIEGMNAREVLKKLSVSRLMLQAFQSYIYNKALTSHNSPCEGPKRLPGPKAFEYEVLLEEEGINLDDLRRKGLKAWPRRPCEETYVEAFAYKNLMRLVFTLPKGYYATAVLREVIKGEPWGL